MFKLLQSNKGQGVAVQYTLTFFLVTGIIVAMAVYVRRGVQGRIRDARTYMLKTVSNVYAGNLYWEYEPYYMDMVADRAFTSTETRRGLPSYPSPDGIFQLDIDQATAIQSTSQQLPPVNAM